MILIKEQSLAQIVIGVADLQPVRELWIEHFGMEVVAEQSGADAALEQLWSLQAGQVAAQLLLRTPGATTGWLHFVQFNNPAAPVRRGAAPHDLCPKNIDVNCLDMAARCAELSAAGMQFRSALSEYTINDLTVREVQAPVHDDINLVLIEVLGWPGTLSLRQYGAVTSFVQAVPDVEQEMNFYQQLGLDLLLQHRVAGEAIEKIVGLPPGAALLLRLMGGEQQLYGRVELIEYERMNGADLYPLAQPPALGSLLGRFATDDLAALSDCLSTNGIAVTQHGQADLLFGTCQMISFRSPAGFLLEAFQLC